MTREEAVELARICAKSKPESYYSEPFEPHEWVINAIILASVCQQCSALQREVGK